MIIGGEIMETSKSLIISALKNVEILDWFMITYNNNKEIVEIFLIIHNH